MKKLFIIFAGGLVLFASCRKERTCVCYNGDGTEAGSKTYAKITKKLAKADCDSFDTYYAGGCELD